VNEALKTVALGVRRGIASFNVQSSGWWGSKSGAKRQRQPQGSTNKEIATCMTQRFEMEEEFYKLSFIEYTRIDESISHGLKLCLPILESACISRLAHRNVRRVRTYRNEISDMALKQNELNVPLK
jgi:hypothetical protein